MGIWSWYTVEWSRVQVLQSRLTTLTKCSQLCTHAQANATDSLGKLQEAADALSTITNTSAGAGGSKHTHHAWDLNQVFQVRAA
jgi:hypothetical protein